ncbi:MAG: nuclear transport factor 2 family protein [Chitinophagales bacterium]
MTATEQLITNFYTAFIRKDYVTMQQCYSENAVFSDPVFMHLNSAEVKAMWDMFCVKGKDLHVDFSNVWANEKTGSAEWVATYTFSATGRKVSNQITSQFIFDNGKIIQQKDSFNFYKWASQAFGVMGVLLSWTKYFKNKVRKQAMKNLAKYMSRK